MDLAILCLALLNSSAGKFEVFGQGILRFTCIISDIVSTTTTTTSKSLPNQAAWGQHSYTSSSSIPIYWKPPFLHPTRKFRFLFNISLLSPPTPQGYDLLFVAVFLRIVSKLTVMPKIDARRKCYNEGKT